MTFSDQSKAATCESKAKLEPNGEEITLTQFFTQQPVLPKENDLIKNMNIPEPYFASSTVRFHEDSSIAGFSKDIVGVNQSNFELELNELISETETSDSTSTDYSMYNQIVIVPERTCTHYSLSDIFVSSQEHTSSPKLARIEMSQDSTQKSNQIVPETTCTQYSLSDIFVSSQEYTSSPNSAQTEFSQNFTQKNEHLKQNLTDISFANFNNTIRVTSPIVSKELQNSQIFRNL